MIYFQVPDREKGKRENLQFIISLSKGCNSHDLETEIHLSSPTCVYQEPNHMSITHCLPECISRMGMGLELAYQCRIWAITPSHFTTMPVSWLSPLQHIVIVPPIYKPEYSFLRVYVCFPKYL